MKTRSICGVIIASANPRRLAAFYDDVLGLVLAPPHDEGFGLTATYLDLEGNQLELVELDYAFAAQRPGE